MAQFALGLTKTAVEGTLSRVKSAIEEEDRQRVRGHDDLVFITGEFQIMQSFLDDLVFITGEFQIMQSFLGVASAERTNNPVVRTWVSQLRDLAFDVEDCVEFVIHLDKASRWDWVSRLSSSLICMARPPLPLDMAVADIKRLKTRVEDVSERNTRYNLISDSGSSSNSAAVATASCSMAELMPATAYASTASTFHTLCEVWEAAGKKRRGTDDLKKLIMSEGSDLQIISLWGSHEAADLGATHAIREAYDDPQIRQEFRILARLKLLHPFNLDQFLKSLLTQFNSTALSHPHKSSIHSEIQATDAVCESDELMQHMIEHRYLVILEDVCTVAEWDGIAKYLPDNKKGSRIVISTQQLGLALSCMRKPYQVSVLGQLSHGQSLRAFINKVPERRSDMSEFTWQLRCGGVISVWGYRGSTTLLDSVYTSITLNSKAFSVNGVEFEKHSWVEVPSPFNLDVFSRRLLLSFYTDDFTAQEIAEVGRMGDQGVTQRCRRFLCEYNCLLVINDLENCHGWDLIKSTFFSKPIKGCILVIAHPSVRDAGVMAKYCANQEEDRAFNIKYLESDMMLNHSIKCSQIYGIGGKEASRRGRLFFNRIEEARIWTKQFGHVVQKEQLHNSQYPLQYTGVFCVCGNDGARKLPFIRRIYYYQLLIVHKIIRHKYFGDLFDLRFTKFSWVDVPHPFSLMDFFWRLLLDFHSDDHQAKEAASLSMMEGQDDPIEGCLKFMRQSRCFIVINGLRSTHDWNSINDAFSLLDPSDVCIVIITNEESLASCLNELIKIKGVEAEAALRPLTEDCGYYGNETHEASRFFSNRRIEAADTVASGLVGSENEVFAPFAQYYFYENHVGVVLVSGISGVGKTALARQIYCEIMLSRKKSFTSFSWVDMPQPFNLMEFCRRLLVDFYSDDLEAKENVTAGMIDGVQDLIQECLKFLHKRSLVVIDGVRSKHDWDLIRDALSINTTKCCIIVIGDEINVASYCTGTNKYEMLNARSLELDAALHLFRKIAFGGKQLSARETEVSKLTMAKCGGLPKVIVAIGKEFNVLQRRIQFLEKLNSNFMGTLETSSRFHSLRGLFGWMQSYFNACPDALKPCIFYLSLFSADCDIRRRRLLRRWIAEGYSRDKFGICAEEDGENLFYELVELSIIQEPPGKSHKDMRPVNEASNKADNVFQVNGFFHGYIVSRQLEDNLVFALEGHSKLNSQRAGQHLTIRSSWDRDEIVYNSMDLSRLRSLTVSGEWRSFFICMTADSSNMRRLRVLDLEDTTSGVTDHVLEQIGKLLHCLKFLSIRGCKEVTHLPDSWGSLRQLQTLDVSYTKITALPFLITKLLKLEYIRAGTSHEPLDQGDNAQPTTAELHGTSTSQTVVTRGAVTPKANDDGTSTSEPAGEAIPGANDDETSTSQPEANSSADGDTEEGVSATPATWRRKARQLVESYSFSLLSTKKKQGRRQGLGNGSGVKVPCAGIGKLTALHTLGLVKVSGAGGIAILKEMKKLTQLHNLRVSGVSPKNWHDICSVISGHNHLESLSVQLDDGQKAGELCCLGDISELPKTLKSLKLYGGNVHASPILMKQLLGYIKYLYVEDVELTISTQEEIDILTEFREQDKFGHLCVKPIQDGELMYGRRDRGGWAGAGFKAATVLKIDCGSYKLTLVFGKWTPKYVEVLVFQCSSSESSLEVSGLEELENLKEVWLKGSYSDELKQHFRASPCGVLLRQPSNPMSRPLSQFAVGSGPATHDFSGRLSTRQHAKLLRRLQRSSLPSPFTACSSRILIRLTYHRV